MIRNLKRLVGILAIVSSILLVFSLFQKNNLPPKEMIGSESYQAPIQKEIIKEPFKIEKDGLVYVIKPLYDYEISGLSVADYNAENWFDFVHKKDPLNTKDTCVIWGQNSEEGYYSKVKFKHGEFTCFVSWNNQTKFNLNEISNNHLIPKDKEVYRKIMEAEIGDQISIKGYLANYEIYSDGQKISYRDTSTNREDTGNGACEIIYVTDFKILARANLLWRGVFGVTKFSVPFFLILFILLFLNQITPQIKEEQVEEKEEDLSSKVLPPRLGV